MAQKKQKKNNEGIVMIRTGIVDKIIIGRFKVDEGVQQDSANNCNFMDLAFFLDGTSVTK